MRMWCLAALGALALAACDREPTFNASSLPAYQKSLGTITARLNEKDRHKLQVALMTLAAGTSADYSAFALADPDRVANLETLDGIANPLTFLDRMRSRIDGRTAAAVIRRVADDLDDAIGAAERQRGGAEKAMAAFVVENARFSWNDSNDRPSVEFSVYNGSNNPISTIYLTGALTAPDLDGPLTETDFSYHFDTPLSPGVQQEVKVNLPAPGPWMKKQLESEYDCDFKVKVSNVGGADGRRLLPINIGWLDVMRKKRDLLRG